MVQRVTLTPDAHGEYVAHCALPLLYVGVGVVSVHEPRAAQPANVEGTLGPFGAPPPSYGTSGSAVPWNSIMAIGREGLHWSAGMSRTPATGANAANRSAA